MGEMFDRVSAVCPEGCGDLFDDLALQTAERAIDIAVERHDLRALVRALARYERRVGELCETSGEQHGD